MQSNTRDGCLGNVHSRPFAMLFEAIVGRLLTSTEGEGIKLYDLDVVYWLSGFFGVASHVESGSSASPWASQRENPRSYLVESHFAGGQRASHESRRSRSQGPCQTVRPFSPCSGLHPRWRRCWWRRCWLPRSGRRGSHRSCPGSSLFRRANRPQTSARRWIPVPSRRWVPFLPRMKSRVGPMLWTSLEFPS